MPRFPHVEPTRNFSDLEREIASLWKRQNVFARTLSERPAPKGSFVFYEGPPTANGTPHNGHVLTRVIKDLFPRYRSMRGYRVDRKAGWDTHGLPVEVEVEKELRIHGKAAIEAFGVEPFVRKCIDSVFRYTAEWERLTERIAFWCDLDAAYVTYHQSFVESVWWALARLLERDLLYRGHKVVWWWAQGGTALSAAEVGQGYRSVDDPSCFVEFALRDPVAGLPEKVSLCVWTTTPWTLPSNMYAAIKGDAFYTVVEAGEKRLIVAELLAKTLAEKIGGAVNESVHVLGRSLDGARYVPPFATYVSRHQDVRTQSGEAAYFRVIVEDFVTLDTGTGIVHIAPAFGEDDHKAFIKLQERFEQPLELFCAVKPDGTFSNELPEWEGQWVKDADKSLLEWLEKQGLLVFKETFRHDYPYCWRADDDPLIQLARPAWFIRTTREKAAAIANNQAVNWLPEHIRDGRMGDFLANNVDWALSRERYWGTPLNVWVCEKDGSHLQAPDSVAAIEKLSPNAFSHFRKAREDDPTINPHLMVHKPWIDHVTFPCPKCGATMHRVPEVIDCWFDSGAMPFAQWGFPHVEGSLEKVKNAWPADFISEAIDQTRGWFYSLLMVSTLVFDAPTRKHYGLPEKLDAHPYKTCMVLGHVCDREGKKESKSKGNYTPPEVILDRVRMEFAVVDPSVTKTSVKAGECRIAREDVDGLDLQDGAKVVVYSESSPNEKRTLTIIGDKKLPRRVVLIPDEDRIALGAQLFPKGLDIKPNEVPRIEAQYRVFVEDPVTPAPGADAFRWFFYSASPPWTNTRHSLTSVRAAQKDYAIKIRNVLSFFSIYANIDEFDPKTSANPSPHLLDRWILSELALTNEAIVAHMDSYQAYESATKLIAFVESLSNWYVRRSRDRFWAPGKASEVPDKQAAYQTLYHVLVTLAKLTAPFTPYLAEDMYQALVVPFFPNDPASIHLLDFPEANPAHIDRALARQVQDARAIVSLGLSIRTQNKLKVRRPLATATIVASDETARGLGQQAAVIREELNVHEIDFASPDSASKYVDFKLKPNFKVLGPKIGKQVQAVKAALEKINAGVFRAALVTQGEAIIEGVSIDGKPLVVTPDEIEVQVVAKEGYAAAADRVGLIVLDTRQTPQLQAEGIARELQSRLQNLRKEQGLAFEARIVARVVGPLEVIEPARAYAAKIASEILADRLDFEVGDTLAGATAIDVDDWTVHAQIVTKP